MKPDLERLAAAFETAPAQPADRSRCLEPAELERAAGNDGSTEEREIWADHFVECGDCAAQYRLLLSLEPLAREAEEAIASERDTRGGATAGGPEPFGRATARRAATLRMAVAAMVVASVGVGIWGFLERYGTRNGTDLAVLDEPQLNVPIIDLEPQPALRGTVVPAPVEMPFGAGFVTLILGTSNDRSCEAYELEIRNTAGGLVWGGPGLERTSYGTFTIGLSRRLLSPGDYRLTLHGRCGGGPREPLEIYAFRVAPR